MDRITTNSRKALKPTPVAFYYPSTADDSIMRDLSKRENIGTVFATDSILSHLMTCTRSVVPWDIIITKVGSKLFFDIREESNFGIILTFFKKLLLTFQKKNNNKIVMLFLKLQQTLQVKKV